MSGRVLVEDLLGRVVVDSEGKKLGRLEEIVADRHPDHLAIVEYHIGELALLERLSAAGVLGSFLKLFVPAAHRGVKVPWEQMDLSDPDHPRATVPKAELRAQRRVGED